MQAELRSQQESAQLVAVAAAASPASESRQARREHDARIHAALLDAIKPFQQAVRQLQGEQDALAHALQPDNAKSGWKKLDPIVNQMMRLLLRAHSEDGHTQPRAARRGHKRPRAPAGSDRAYSLALAWFEQQVEPEHAGAQVDIFDKLLYCGEEIASDIAHSSTGANSYIFILRPLARGEDKHWYERVSYYIRHRFRGRSYHFAATRWYAYATEEERERLWPHYRTVHAPFSCSAAAAASGEVSPSAGVASAAEHKLRTDACSSTFERFPVLRWSYYESTLADLIPVHRIGGR